MRKRKALIEAVCTNHANGEKSIRLSSGRTLKLTKEDAALLEIGFHTHCPDCKHRTPEKPPESQPT